LIKSKQDDKTISLDYNSYKEDQEEFKLQSDKLKVIEEFNSPYLFEWNDNNLNANSSYNDDMKEKRDRWIESLQKDIYVDEAMNLLKDLSSLKGNDILSQINID
jgi:carboxyl-terminal processing protease